MPAASVPLELERHYTREEWALLRHGFVPRDMDDRWSISYDSATDQLFVHRSWSGFCIYLLRFAADGDETSIVDARVNRDAEQYKGVDLAYDREFCLWLIDRWLLGVEREPPCRV